MQIGFREKFQEVLAGRQAGSEGYRLDKAAYNADAAVNALQGLSGDFCNKHSDGLITDDYYAEVKKEIGLRLNIIRNREPFKRL